MKISSRFTVAVHILSLVHIERNQTLTSAYIAGSVNTNSVVIRRLISKLKQAGFLETHQGSGGIQLLKPLTDITLLDVYRAVEVVEEGELFQMHEDTNINCVVGANIQSVLEIVLLRAQDAMETVLANVTMDDIVSGIVQQNG
ncbi:MULTISPECIES: Rrf2 family transcriptional regulator [Staphylococcus]|uniref:Rrf2 family transcriptional regulator n=3 Tax=Staphylococcus TaxID=1279 RepID=A0ABM7FMN1_9STAP|nr:MULTISPECIES: Rrf2 family transcriptional regulator [Staphylococcus]EES41374.1 transcriptional regulator, Rrf2 family [Staphylococcus caprae M23864:W1]MBN6826761.1 Rrf2 family transcriptional regulator [Staphylococcus caprae]MBU5272580.1 Rrf2 family transcriptional regulator [Staphylococcus caprae]MBX5316898.1 Rrf2 family transcriptional regulator [Staphylococcus caprae]MBX5318912.1 Rrf2 family transcriptional regulator [Staphylococcus caprae]